MPPAAAAAAAAAAAPLPGGGDGTSSNPYFYYRRTLSQQSSGGGGSAPSNAGTAAAGSTSNTAGTIRYSCLPSSHLSPANRIGWGGPHVTVGVRSVNASPLVGPLASLLAGRSSSAAASSTAEEKKLEDVPRTSTRSIDGGSAVYIHPFHALPYSPSSVVLEPSSANDLVAPQEVTVTATLTGLCVGAGTTHAALEMSTRSVPLVPIALDPGFAIDRSGSNDPPPVCLSTHVARFDDDDDDGTRRNAPMTTQHGEELTLPIRYRDLSRDAAIQFHVYAPYPHPTAPKESGRRRRRQQRRPGGGILVAKANMSLFDETSKLRTGLQKLRLVPVSVDGREIGDGSRLEEKSDDELWEATLILEGIRQTKARAEAAVGNKRSAGSTSSGGRSSGATAPSTPTRSLAGGGLTGSLTQSSAATGYGRSRQQQQSHPHPQQQQYQLGPNFSNSNPTGPVPWLDEMTRNQCLEEIDTIRSHIVSEDILLTSSTAASASSSMPPAHLVVELPDFNIPIVHEETPYPPPANGASGSVTAYDVSLYRRQRAKAAGSDRDTYDAGLSLVQVLDYETTNDPHDPVEDKYRTLAHDLLRGHIDPSLKPSRAQRAKLSDIISSPSHHHTNEERDLLWRFRFHLVDDRRALSKFLLAVDWSQPSEVVQAAELLEQWKSRSPIEVTDALRLLGKDVSDRAGKQHAGLVREYAIETLGKAEDAELRLYLLQLVQAVKYEADRDEDDDASVSTSKGRKMKKKAVKSSKSLASFLIDRASRNLQLANYLYWYLRVELDDPTHGTHYKHVFDSLKDQLSKTVVDGRHDGNSDQRVGLGNANRSTSGVSGGMSSSSSVHSYSVKSALRGMKGMGAKIEKALLNHGIDGGAGSGGTGGHAPPSMWDVLSAQDSLISGIMDCQRRARDARGKKDAKEMFLRDALAVEGYGKIKGGLMTSRGGSVPLPSAPGVMVTGVRAESVKMFKSALYPAVVEFNVGRRTDTDSPEKFRGKDVYTTRSELSTALTSNDNNTAAKKVAEAEHNTFKVIVKTGDDLRQDQLVIMMIQLMDRLLKRATLDLFLKPYAILATSPSTGLVEFVDGSVPISQVLANNNNSILQYFKKASPKQGAKYGIDPNVMQTYIRSLAGYCVITYLLGIGDRHLDNIMLQASGHFFHIDFGFIFGQDPKPLPPAFRLTREMVDGMGGTDSSEYSRFCSLSCQAFNTLRKSAGLVLNLLHLMSDAGIEDLSNNPAADAEGVIAKVEERFRLELTDEQAEAYFVGLIDESLNALAPRVMEVFHQLSVARR